MSGTGPEGSHGGRIKDSELKKRFLKRLGFDAHVHRRSRTLWTSDTRGVFEESIGGESDTSYDDLMSDLIASGLVIQTAPYGELSFGHLTFQEHLAGSYLAGFMSPLEVLPLCRDSWWREPIKFYASKKGDMGPLVMAAQSQKQTRFMIDVLTAALSEAPYTPKRMARILHDAMGFRRSEDQQQS